MPMPEAVRCWVTDTDADGIGLDADAQLWAVIWYEFLIAAEKIKEPVAKHFQQYQQKGVWHEMFDFRFLTISFPCYWDHLDFLRIFAEIFATLCLSRKAAKNCRQCTKTVAAALLLHFLQLPQQQQPGVGGEGRGTFSRIPFLPFRRWVQTGTGCERLIGRVFISAVANKACHLFLALFLSGIVQNPKTVPEFIGPVFAKTSPKRSVFNDWKWAFWACFREN